MAVLYQQLFEKAETVLQGTYEECVFRNCDFSGLSLNGFTFENCEFHSCNLSNAEVRNSSFQQVGFTDCKLLGMQFHMADPFSFEVYFSGSQLDFSSFYRCSLKNSKFAKCSLTGVDFTEANLQGIALEECDLKNAVFQNSNLEKTDFRTSFNFTIHPEHNKIKKAKFSLGEVAGLLSVYGIEIS